MENLIPMLHLKKTEEQWGWVDCSDASLSSDLYGQDGFSFRTMETIEVEDDTNYKKSLAKFQNHTQMLPSLYTDFVEYTTFKRGHNSDVDSKRSPSYTLDKKRRDNMSFVGLRLNKETGIVIAFADSKSTVKKNGEIVGTESIDKILDLGGMILVIFGQTTFFSRSGEPLNVRDEILKTSNNGMLNEALLWDIRESFYHCTKEGNLGILFVVKNCQFVGKIRVTAYELTTSYQYVDDNIQLVYGGDLFYVQEFDKIRDKSKIFPKNTLKRKIEKLIEKRDQMPGCNPVGKPVRIQEWSIY